MRADPDDRIRTEDPASITNRHVVLPEVDAVSLREKRDVGPIVDDEQHVMLTSDSADLASHLEQPAITGGLLAKLDDLGAARARLAHSAGKRRPADRFGRQHVKSAVREALPA